MNPKNHLPGAAASAAAALLWVLLAWRTPTSTHHFAPLVIGGAWGYLVRKGSLPAPSSADRLLMFGGSLAISLLAYALLAGSDKILGPALIESIPANVELPLMALAGSVIGSGVWCLLTTPTTHAPDV